MEEGQQVVQPLYAHLKRKEWGLAILAWESDGKRGYQFQDGQLRTFKDGYFHHFKQVDKPIDEAVLAVRDLKSMLRDSLGAAYESVAPPKNVPTVTVEEQILVFKEFYPEGFHGEDYVDAVRGTEDGKTLKRHVDKSVQVAQELLNVENLDDWIGSEDAEAVREALLEVLGSTDIVGTKDLAPLKTMDEAQCVDVANALRELLYGEAPFEARFSRWCAVLTGVAGSRISWPLATVPPALMFPDQHVAVKPSVFRSQAQFMAPSLRYDATPQPKVYQRFRNMAQAIFTKLEENGLKPRDLLDVRAFIWTSLRPKGMAKLEKYRKPVI